MNRERLLNLRLTRRKLLTTFVLPATGALVNGCATQNESEQAIQKEKQPNINIFFATKSINVAAAGVLLYVLFHDIDKRNE